jgi:NAD-dependent dihydropyrimidine dehydrogenase PreA subunit
MKNKTVLVIPDLQKNKRRKRTPENEKKWESFDFGHLCHLCNTRIPTNGRIEFLKKALAYALRSQGGEV